MLAWRNTAHTGYATPGVLDPQGSGIDYAGPIHVRTSRGRGKLTSKGYIAVFICLATRAVHLEAVSDGSTETFLAALRRPILPLSDDPEDPAALTPGHFLVGEPLLAIPEPSLEELSVSRLSRWQLVQQMQQHFWRRWSREYLNSLQPRGKWRRDQAWVKAGSLCLVKNEILPPTQWPLARVVHVHPGPDGSTRVVTLRTSTSQLLRPVHKLIPLLAPEIDETGHGNNLEAGLSA
ncbi:uncharacterized protein LOC143363987 [Halictus rubicundus]|uniref:uncharacterized protein LOC143363987 n=1 Tax=Halictus rubicundus TaxID=77578 RepID=UPI004035AF7D